MNGFEMLDREALDIDELWPVHDLPFAERSTNAEVSAPSFIPWVPEVARPSAVEGQASAAQVDAVPALRKAKWFLECARTDKLNRDPDGYAEGSNSLMGFGEWDPQSYRYLITHKMAPEGCTAGCCDSEERGSRDGAVTSGPSLKHDDAIGVFPEWWSENRTGNHPQSTTIATNYGPRSEHESPYPHAIHSSRRASPNHTNPEPTFRSYRNLQIDNTTSGDWWHDPGRVWDETGCGVKPRVFKGPSLPSAEIFFWGDGPTESAAVRNALEQCFDWALEEVGKADPGLAASIAAIDCKSCSYRYNSPWGMQSNRKRCKKITPIHDFSVGMNVCEPERTWQRTRTTWTFIFKRTYKWWYAKAVGTTRSGGSNAITVSCVCPFNW